MALAAMTQPDSRSQRPLRRTGATLALVCVGLPLGACEQRTQQSPPAVAPPPPTTTPTAPAAPAVSSPPTSPAPGATPAPSPDTTATPAASDPWPPPANPPLPTMQLKLGGRTFTLEKALDDQTRFRGLSGRREIAADGGMIFVFRQPHVMQFVMRDCPIPIDILYVDATGRITAMYHMKPEPPRGEGERENDPRLGVNAKYESRLRKYSSRFSAIIAIELRANTLNINGSNPDGLPLKVGDKLEDLDVAELRKLAK